MFVIIVLLMIISLIVGLGWYLCSRTINVSAITARRIELFGYYLLFVLLVWQLILKGIMMEDFYEGELFLLTQKINHIFEFIQSTSGFSYTTPEFSIEQFDKSISGEKVQLQMKWVDVIEVVLTIASTICIAIGRFYELSAMKTEK